jgi:hypothetical protein
MPSHRQRTIGANHMRLPGFLSVAQSYAPKLMRMPLARPLSPFGLVL